MILAGDIGGTNSRLAMIELGTGTLALKISEQADFLNREFPSFGAIVAAFRQKTGRRAEVAALAVAGPVVNNRVTGSNLPWHVDAELLQSQAGFERVVLLNDLLALAYGIHELPSEDLITLQEGKAVAAGNCAVVAAGTGLGEAGLLWRPGGYAPFPSEGGHADFGPNNAIEAELYLYLRERFGHVSTERVLSGHGLENIYAFLRDTRRYQEPSSLADELTAAHDRAAVISKHGVTGEHRICEVAIEMFISIYGAEAGNVALNLFATGGIFLGGGIAPKLTKGLREPRFLAAFRSKGRMQPLLDAIPVRLITNEHTGLIGAAAYGRDSLGAPAAHV